MTYIGSLQVVVGSGSGSRMTLYDTTVDVCCSFLTRFVAEASYANLYHFNFANGVQSGYPSMDKLYMQAIDDQQID